MKYGQSVIDVIGPIWWPAGGMAATSYTVSAYDVENMREESGQLSRDSVALWLDAHAGDFQHVADFHASIEDAGETIDMPWEAEESEFTFTDSMFPDYE